MIVRNVAEINNEVSDNPKLSVNDIQTKYMSTLYVAQGRGFGGRAGQQYQSFS